MSNKYCSWNDPQLIQQVFLRLLSTQVSFVMSVSFFTFNAISTSDKMHITGRKLDFRVGISRLQNAKTLGVAAISI